MTGVLVSPASRIGSMPRTGRSLAAKLRRSGITDPHRDDGEIDESDPAIQMSNVVKTFGPTRALDGLDLVVRRGEIHGFLGPNGAGKSVTIRTLLGLLRIDSGTVSVLGGDPWLDAVPLHRRLAYVPGDVSLWPNLSGGEIIDYLARLRGDTDPVLRAELVERFELDLRKKARTYSRGNRQKVALIAALSADVELLLLDEPTAGLDPLMEQTFQDVITDLAGRGRTIVLSSHILAEVEKLCDRVTIIRQGRAVRTGSLAELGSARQIRIEVTTQRPLTGIDSLDGVDLVERPCPCQAELLVDAEALPRAIQSLSGFGVTSLVSSPRSLEELFLREYEVAGDDTASSS